MRIVVDTSVVVSAAIRDRDPERLLLLITDHPDWLWLASDAVRAEYVEVLSRPKFGLPRELIGRWSRWLDSAVTAVDTDMDVSFDRDPDDRPFLACALVGAADVLVTGDRDLLDLGHVGSTRILSVLPALAELLHVANAD